MLVVFSLTLHSQCLDYNGNPVENFYKAPSNLSDLSYKIKIYGDTLDCVLHEFNYKGEWNNNLIFGSKKALNILEEGISQIKFKGKNEKALKKYDKLLLLSHVSLDVTETKLSLTFLLFSL